MKSPDTLFYDGKCPLCLREVRLLQRLAGDGLRLANLHVLSPRPGEPSPEDMLRILHLRMGSGEWLTGVDATVRAWSHTRWSFLFRMLRLPLIGPLADGAYRYWARKRFQRLYGCQTCADVR